jgi:hypothetical protein
VEGWPHEERGQGRRSPAAAATALARRCYHKCWQQAGDGAAVAVPGRCRGGVSCIAQLLCCCSIHLAAPAARSNATPPRCPSAISLPGQLPRLPYTAHPGLQQAKGAAAVGREEATGRARRHSSTCASAAATAAALGNRCQSTRLSRPRLLTVLLEDQLALVLRVILSPATVLAALACSSGGGGQRAAVERQRARPSGGGAKPTASRSPPDAPGPGGLAPEAWRALGGCWRQAMRGGQRGEAAAPGRAACSPAGAPGPSGRTLVLGHGCGGLGSGRARRRWLAGETGP